MTAANDSAAVLQVAPETSVGVLPAYTLTVTGTPTGGSLTLSIGGNTPITIPYNSTNSAAQTAIAADSYVGAGNVTVTGGALPGTPLVITFAGYRAGFDLTVDGTGLTGGTSPTAALTGGPVWTTVKATKYKPNDKLNIKVPDEIRNAPDTEYADSVVVGGQITDWSITAALRADQLGHLLALCGFADSVSTSGGVTTHTMKPGAGSTRKTYALRSYNGKDTRISTGCYGSNIKFTGKSGESGEYTVDWKGFGQRRQTLPYNPTITLPSNTTYRRISPTNTGVSLSIAGSVNSLVEEWDFDWTWETTPIFTQTGAVTYYRAESKKRHLKSSMTLLFDDATEAAAALAAIPATEALAFTLQGTENISGGVYDTVNISIPAHLYTDLDLEEGLIAPKLKLTGQSLYNTAAAAQVSIVIKNATTAAYS